MVGPSWFHFSTELCCAPNVTGAALHTVRANSWFQRFSSYFWVQNFCVSRPSSSFGLPGNLKNTMEVVTFQKVHAQLLNNLWRGLILLDTRDEEVLYPQFQVSSLTKSAKSVTSRFYGSGNHPSSNSPTPFPGSNSVYIFDIFKSESSAASCRSPDPPDLIRSDFEPNSPQLWKSKNPRNIKTTGSSRMDQFRRAFRTYGSNGSCMNTNS